MLTSSTLFLVLIVGLVVVSSSSAVDAQQAFICPVNYPDGTPVQAASRNASALVGYFPSMKLELTDSNADNDFYQLFSGSTNPLSLSLCDPSIQADGAPVCAAGRYISMNNDCGMSLLSPPSSALAALTNGGRYVENGITYSFSSAQTESKTWSATVNCKCDISHDTLYSPTNSYQAAIIGNHINFTFNLRSSGCCLRNQLPVPQYHTFSCPSFNFSNGSKVSFSDPSALIGQFPLSYQPSSYYPPDQFYVSLCGVRINETDVPDCSRYAALSIPSSSPTSTSSCFFTVQGPPTISSFENRGVTFQYGQFTVNCICDHSAPTLISPSGTYTANTSPQSPPIASGTWEFSSRGCCVDPPSSYRTPVVFSNGSTISFANPDFLTGYFPAITESGIAKRWSMSLVDPTLAQAPFAMSCSSGKFLTMADNDCSDVAFTNAPSASPLSDGSGLQFNFNYSLINNNVYSASVTCTCDSTFDNLFSPSNSYQRANSGGNFVDFVWSVRSKGCCVDAPSPPAPERRDTNACAPLTLANGSVVTFENASDFVASWPNGITQYTIGYPQSQNITVYGTMSLCNPLAFQAPPNASCSIGDFASLFYQPQYVCDPTDRSSIQTFTLSPSIFETEDGSGVTFLLFGAFSAMASALQVRCECSPSGAADFGDIFFYEMADTMFWMGSSVLHRFYNFTTRSKGCCAQAATTTTTTSVAPSSTTPFPSDFNTTTTSTVTSSSTSTSTSTSTPNFPTYTDPPTTSDFNTTTSIVTSSMSTSTSTPTYTGPPTTTEITTTVPVSGNQCNPVTFPNGSYVPFTNYQKLTGYFPSIQQTGLNPHTASWSLSLCDPSIVPSSGGQVCNPHSYLSENGCQTIFPELSFQTHSSKDQQVGFTYIRRVNATVVHYAYVYCACDSTAQNELKIPSNSYYVYRDPSGDMIEFWHVSSAECCAINPTGMSTTTATTSSSVPQTTPATTTPSPSSNNHGGGGGSASSGNCSSSSSTEDKIKNFLLPAAGAAVGTVFGICFVWLVYTIYKKCCYGNGNSSGGSHRSTITGGDDLRRSAYEAQLFSNDDHAVA